MALVPRAEASTQAPFRVETTAVAIPSTVATVSDTCKPKKPKRKKLHLRTRELVRFRCKSLELDIMDLRQEIATLERTRSLLYARVLNRADAPDGSVMKTVHQFYKLLRHGFNDVVWLDDRPLDFRQFIHACFDDVLALGPDPTQKIPHGRDHLVEHLAHMTALTGTPNVEMLDVTIHTERDNRTATVLVKTVCTSPLSVLMLEAKYAHVSLFPQLKAKLVGRTIAAYGEARYVFDLHTGRIVLAHVQADHAGAILQVVDTADEYEILYGGHGDAAFAQLMETPQAASPTASLSTDNTSEESVSSPGGSESTSRATASAMSLDFLLS